MTLIDKNYRGPYHHLDDDIGDFTSARRVQLVNFRFTWRSDYGEHSFYALVVKWQKGWDVQNVTPYEQIPRIARADIRSFIIALCTVLSETLHGPIVRFPTDVFDWDMMVNSPYVGDL